IASSKPSGVGSAPTGPAATAKAMMVMLTNIVIALEIIQPLDRSGAVDHKIRQLPTSDGDFRAQ
ncbi:hypothetical protein V9111_10740, partial [Streptococcus agalactiae]